MKVIRNEVLLLKAPKDEGNDKYETILKENGFNVKYLQILDFDFINLSELQLKLCKENDYTGIIFTSPRAVTATKLCLNYGNASLRIKDRWGSKKNYVVGEATHELVEQDLSLQCQGKESGNANNLAERIITEHLNDDSCNFLFPCGNLKKETLAKRLNEKGIKLDATTVYETVKSKHFNNDFKNVTNSFQDIPEIIVYFSPSGVKFTTNDFKLQSVPFEKLKLIAIGPSTEETLKIENLPIYSMATKPTENELLKAILK